MNGISEGPHPVNPVNPVQYGLVSVFRLPQRFAFERSFVRQI